MLEGIDGSGKGTQIETLCRGIREAPAEFGVPEGVPITATREPTDGRIGRLIREYLKGADTIDPRALALLFTADRIENLERVVVPRLQGGGIVVSDRYAYSTIAYQGAGKADMEWICTLNRDVITPDLIIYIDISPNEAIKRIYDGASIRANQEKEIFEKKPAFLDEVRRIYLEITGHRLKVSGRYGFLDARFEVVDGAQLPDDVSAQIRRSVREIVGGRIPP